MAFRRMQVSAEVERKLLTGLIVDDDFCRKTLQILGDDYIEVSFARPVVQWIREYFTNYGKSPKHSIQDLFVANQQFLDPEEANTISTFLKNLSVDFTSQAEINWQYWHNEAVEFCSRRSLEKLSAEIDGNVSMNRLEDARRVILNYRSVSDMQTESAVTLTDEAIIRETFAADDEHLFKFSGQLGDLVGPIKRGWFISWFGAAKRGKSWWLMETAIEALTSRLNVVFFSLEMNRKDLNKRFYKRLAGMTDYPGQYTIPTFDCKKNQDDSCQLAERTNDMKLFIPNTSTKPNFRPNMEYRPCCYCKDHGMDDNYEPETWFRTLEQTSSLHGVIRKKMRGFNTTWGGDRLKIKCYPRFGASVDQLEADLLEMEQVHDFVPDVIIIDYADIFSTYGLKEQGRDRYDEVWKMLGKMAMERQVALFTASQTNRESFRIKNVKDTHAAEDIRKIAHIDIGLAISQSWEDSYNEKEMQRQRINVMVNRHGGENHDSAWVLQWLKGGQTHLESYVSSINRRDDVNVKAMERERS